MTAGITISNAIWKLHVVKKEMCTAIEMNADMVKEQNLKLAFFGFFLLKI